MCPLRQCDIYSVVVDVKFCTQTIAVRYREIYCLKSVVYGLKEEMYFLINLVTHVVR